MPVDQEIRDRLGGKIPEGKVAPVEEVAASSDSTPLCIHMTDEELKQFIRDYLAGQIFVSASLSDAETERNLKTIFPVLLLAGEEFLTKMFEQRDTLGCIWEYRSKAAPRMVNGYPMFFSCHLMHQDDWTRARAAIVRESERLENIEV